MTKIDNSTAQPARTSTRPTVTYKEYVGDFGKSAARYLGLAVGGITLIATAIIYLQGGAMVLAAAAGVGIAAAGAGGLLAVTIAHEAYTQHMGLTTTTTYTAPAPTPTVRPFIPSSNGPRTIRAGRFQLPAATWRALFDAAEANGGRLTRDAAAKVLPRAMYRDWATTADELRRLGLIDEAGQVTADGRRFILSDVSPYPEGGEAHTSAHSTHARRTHGAHGMTL